MTGCEEHASLLLEELFTAVKSFIAQARVFISPVKKGRRRGERKKLGDPF